MKRVAVFVDGFNLYHSLEELGNSRVKWLDLKALAQQFLKSDEVLTTVNYFTALSTWDQEKQLRHKRYIRALTLSGVNVIFGRFKNRPQTCSQCGFRYKGREEKRTDVNIAVALLTGAVRDEYDTALLVSGDTDLIPAIHAVRELYPAKRLGILFPMNRHTGEMEQAADFSETIKVDVLESARLPARIRLPSGKDLTPPDEWL
jgi:uncharacterized LabA/DUF88 family protein